MMDCKRALEESNGDEEAVCIDVLFNPAVLDVALATPEVAEDDDGKPKIKKGVGAKGDIGDVAAGGGLGYQEASGTLLHALEVLCGKRKADYLSGTPVVTAAAVVQTAVRARLISCSTVCSCVESTNSDMKLVVGGRGVEKPMADSDA